MIDLLPELSFGDNLRPSQVTAALRRELADFERRRRNALILVPSFLMLLASPAVFAGVFHDGQPLPWSLTMWTPFVGAWAIYVLVIRSIYSRRTRFLQYAEVTTAAITDKETISFWALGSLWGSWSTPLPRSVRESLDMEDDGSGEAIPHRVKLQLRIIPGAGSERLDWSALRDEVPHYDVTQRLPGGGWGTFIGDLRQGSLISVLYSPENPEHCRIVQRFRSHQRLKNE